MKRDIRIIKYVLEEIERLQQNNSTIQMTFDDGDTYPVEQLNYHLSMLVDAGFVDANITKTKGPEDQINMIKSITWQGHDLLDALRNDKAMELAEEEAEKEGSHLSELPIEVAKSLLIASAKKLFQLD